MTTIEPNLQGDRYWITWNGILFFSDGNLKKIYLSAKKNPSSTIHNQVDETLPTILHDGSKDEEKINAAIASTLLQKDYGRYFMGLLFKNRLFFS
jgi:hypothetical protein